MNRSTVASRSFVSALAITALLAAACSSNDPGNSPADASADTRVAVDGANDTAPPSGDAQADASDGNNLLLDASDGSASPDASDAGDSGATLTPQRVDAIRACMDVRWGSSPTRAAIDVADDFDQCSTPPENTSAVGDANFALVVDGWAEPDPSDHSLMRKVVRDH